MEETPTTRLLREVILPRLDAHEAELAELRAATWPVCQALKDSNYMPKNSMPFRNISEKKRFFHFLDPDEIRHLLGLKSRWANISEMSMREELRMVVVHQT